MMMLNTAGHYVDANAAAFELLGVTLTELWAARPDRFAMGPANDAETDRV